MIENIKAAIAHLEAIAAELEAGAEHDVERLVSDVRDFLHLGYAEVTSRRAEAPVAAPAPVEAPAAPVEAPKHEPGPEPEPEQEPAKGNEAGGDE